MLELIANTPPLLFAIKLFGGTFIFIIFAALVMHDRFLEGCVIAAMIVFVMFIGYILGDMGWTLVMKVVS